MFFQILCRNSGRSWSCFGHDLKTALENLSKERGLSFWD
jgi:hypothetical protein